ncbi:hypothetical protein D083_0664 [Dickeya solani RNS 08.23.3.1.A]|nr:hypothetical protein D083_0664 [Dickeya solani RNS 08.23.3.1.A]
MTPWRERQSCPDYTFINIVAYSNNTDLLHPSISQKGMLHA